MSLTLIRLNRSPTPDAIRTNAQAIEEWISLAAPAIAEALLPATEIDWSIIINLPDGIDALVTLSGGGASPGDLFYFDPGSGTWGALPIGTVGQVLTSNGVGAAWATPVSGSGGTFWQAEVDFGSSVVNYVETTVAAKTGATTDMQFSVTGYGATTDHDIEDALLEELRFDVSCLVDGSFFVRGYAPNGTFGTFKLNIRGEVAVFTP